MGFFDIFRRLNKNDAADYGAFMGKQPTGNGDDHGKPVLDRMQPTMMRDQPSSVEAIPAKVLRKITKNFRPTALIGVGTCGGVFHGVLGNGQAVAIKKLDTSKQSEQDFLARLSKASGLNNENVVRLVGYCAESELRAVDYECAPQGSLYDILHGCIGSKSAPSEPLQVLSWNARVKIAVGIAKGLEYLHKKCDPHIVLLNLKSSNVLIFDDFVTKIDVSNLFSEVPYLISCLDTYPGTIGALVHNAPELILPGMPTVKSDIYSFGVFMLEILTGRKPFDRTLPRRQENRVTWATLKLAEGKVSDCIDNKLQGEYPPKAVAKVDFSLNQVIRFTLRIQSTAKKLAQFVLFGQFASLAAMCLISNPGCRPNSSIRVTYPIHC